MTVPPSPPHEQQDTSDPKKNEPQVPPVTIPIEKPSTPSSVKPRRIAPKQPSSPIKKGVFFFSLALILYTLFGFLVAPLLITSVGSSYLEKRLGRPVTIGTAQVNPFRLQIVLKNGIIGGEKNNPEDKVDPFFSFGRLKIKLHPQAIFTNQTPFQAIHGNSVFLHVVRNLDESSNLQQLFPQTDQTDAFGLQAVIDGLKQIDLKLTDAKLLFEDNRSNTTHTISQIRFRLPAPDSQGDSLYFSASINGSPIEFGGFSEKPQTDEQRFALHLKDISLPAYLNYLPDPFPTLINRGKADLDITITTQNSGDGFDLRLSGTGVARDIWVNDGKENHNKVDTASFSFSSTLKEQRVIFHTLILEKPELHLSRDQDGYFFFPAKESFMGTAPEHTITLENIVINNGKLVFIDQSIPGGFGVSFNDVNLSIDKNKDGNTASYGLNCTTDRNTRIASQGTITPAMWQIQGLFILKGLPISALNSYLNQPDGITVTSGIVEKLETSFSLSPRVPHKLTNLAATELTIKDLGLNVEGKEFITIPQVNLRNSSYSSEKQLANLGQVELHNGQFRLTPSTPFPIPTFEDGKNQLQWKMDRLSIKDSRAQFRDFDLQKEAQAIDIPLLTATNISSNPQDTATISASVKLLKQATWTTKGSLQFNPFSGSFNSALHDVPLAHIPEPLLQWLKPPLLAGVLSAQVQFALPDPVFTGSADIKGLELRYGKQHEQLTVKQLHTTGNLSLSPLNVELHQVDISGLHTTVPVSRKKLLSRADFFTMGSESDSTAASVAIGHIGLSESSFTLVDQTTEPPFTYTISSTSGAIDNINSTGTETTKLQLQGRGNDQTRFTLSGTSQFFTETFGADLTATITDFPLADIRQVIEPITGYGVQGGMFDLNIRYHEAEGSMTSSTMLDLRHLTLTNEAKGNNHFPDIVALLTDADHHIRLSIPINGEATDPLYTFHSAYGKKLGELFLGIMVSPFSALRDYYNATQYPPNQILFIPGTSTLAPEQQDKLLVLQTIIKNRPLLHITLTGYSGSMEDRQTLLKEKQAAEQKQQQIKAIEAAGTAVVESYGQELITPKQTNSAPALPAHNTTLTKQELRDLASNRSAAIKAILMEQYGIEGNVLHLDPNPTVVPQSDSGLAGHRVECIVSGQAP